MEVQLLTAYLIAITLLTITPGADTMLIIRNTARGGWRDGAVSSIGICSGLFAHAAISAVGISVILLQTAWAFSTLKLIGACYLVWLGISNWNDVLKNKQIFIKDDIYSATSHFKCLRSLREGFLSNILNPKTAVFYMAFLPQFINPTKSTLIQSLILVGFHFIIAMIWQCLLALTVNRAKNLLQQPKVSRIFSGLTGSVMILYRFPGQLARVYLFKPFWPSWRYLPISLWLAATRNIRTCQRCTFLGPLGPLPTCVHFCPLAA